MRIINKIKRVAIDLDDCLNTLVQDSLKALEKRSGIRHDISELTRFNIRECLPQASADIMYDIWHRDETLWQNLSPPTDAQMIVKQLINDGYEVIVATASFFEVVPIKVEWLRRVYPFIPTENIIIISKKQLLDVDVLIDDRAENLIGGKYIGILVDKPWNRWVDDREHGIYRVKNMTEAYKVIEKLNGGK